MIFRDGLPPENKRNLNPLMRLRDPSSGQSHSVHPLFYKQTLNLCITVVPNPGGGGKNIYLLHKMVMFSKIFLIVVIFLKYCIGLPFNLFKITRRHPSSKMLGAMCRIHENRLF